jgi:uncharacterized protein YjbI with pentapeptide repeats
VGSPKASVLGEARFAYGERMFSLALCAAGCGQLAVTGSALCADHSADRGAESERVSGIIREAQHIHNFSAGRLAFYDADFSKKRITASCFFKSVFTNCNFTKSLFRTGFFDFAVFENCDFRETNMEFLSFGGATFKDCAFNNSELTHLNFSGVKIQNCDFSGSNLYNSRFIAAKIQNTLMVDCNVKKVFFIGAAVGELDLHASNDKEAVYSIDEVQ